VTFDGFLRLAVQTVTRPREVAALLVSLNLSREALLTAFALVVVLNTLFFGLTQLVVPAGNILVPVMQDPVMFGLSLMLTLAALIFAITACGRPFEGDASIEQIAVLVIWLQALRALLQAVVLLLAPVSLFLSGLIVTASTVVGIWIFANFVDVAHNTNSLWKAGVVLLLAVVGMMLVLSMIFSLLGVSPSGVAA